MTDRIRNMDIQSMGGTRKTVEAGIDVRARGAGRSRTTVERETVPASELNVALQCGGSDGYSGVTANPALGVASDLVVRHGGTVDPVGNDRDLRCRAPAHAARGQPRRSARSSSS